MIQNLALVFYFHQVYAHSVIKEITSNQQEDLIQQSLRSLPPKHLHFNQWKDLCPLYLMKIQEYLLWDKYSGELIGFVDLGDIHTNFATLDDVKELTTHVLVFLVKSIVNPLSYSLATFATTGVISFQIMPILHQ